MNKLTYEQIQTIQEKTTKKLIDYINEFIKKDKSLDSIEFYYPNFDEQKTMVAFNVWVSIDYKTNHDKTFIEHMLEEKSNQLSNLEKQILIERNKSHISLFEILKIKGEYIYLVDLLTRKKHAIWEPSMANILKSSDLIFGRIGKIIHHESFIGNISFLPSSVKDTFIEEVFLDYNYIRLKFAELSIDEYLKQYSVNLYRIYTECIYDVIEIDEDTTSILYDELEEFENYLQTQVSRQIIKKHITNLINLFEYYLIDEDMTLYDLDQIDFKYLLDKAINDGLISTQSELSSYISTFKKYLSYLKSKIPVYKEAYENILEISKNRFLYMDKFKQTDPIFEIDGRLSSRIANILNDKSFEFIMDYERFILYIMSTPLELTKKRKYIKRKDLLKINEIMENRKTITKKSPNQEDFPMLHLFYIFSLEYNIIKIKNGLLHTTKRASRFLRINDEEKYSLFIQYIWGDKFLSSISKTLNPNSLEATRKSILGLLSNLEENTFYKYNTLLPACIKFPEFLSTYYKYLELIGLLKYSYSPRLSISITPFGKIVFKALAEGDSSTEDRFNVISLNSYNKNK
ncbi:MAG: hypothetical protein GX987_01185 [Tissierellia bacterium]|nr:hypothetical protein [Tissierellia bacterium]